MTLEAWVELKMAAVQLQAMVARRPPKEAVQKLSADDRAWLEQRLREYRRLLDYLRDH